MSDPTSMRRERNMYQDEITKQERTRTYLNREALPKNYNETGKRVIRTISLTREQELGYMKVLCVLEFHQL